MAGANALFEQLDSRTITAGGTIWQLHVYSVQQAGERCWIQVGLSADDAVMRTAIVRAAASVEAEEVLARVTAWIAASADQISTTIEMD